MSGRLGIETQSLRRLSRLMRDTVLVALFVPLALAPLPAQEPSNNRHPAVSADGQRIFFDSDRDGNSEIYVMNADGSNVRRLTFDPGEDMGAERDADGWIVFARSEGPGTYPRTYLMSPDGSTFKELDNPESIHWAWSSDRRMVLKGSGQIGDNAIYIMSADGSNRRPLTRFLEGSFNSDMSFSPDGSRVVYESYIDTPVNGEVYVVDVEGSNPMRLAAGTDPVWSPDGSSVAYKALNEDGSWEIRVIDPDGSSERSIAVGWYPRWFPDSRRLAYFAPVDGRDQIFVVDLTDGTRIQLTN